MKKYLCLAVLCFTFLGAGPAFAAGETVHIKVLGLVCDFCAKSIDKVFMETGKVKSTDVDLDSALVTIIMNQDQIFDDEFIKEKITNAGYAVENIHHQLGD